LVTKKLRKIVVRLRHIKLSENIKRKKGMKEEEEEEEEKDNNGRERSDIP